MLKLAFSIVYRPAVRLLNVPSNGIGNLPNVTATVLLNHFDNVTRGAEGP